ncbi:MAG: acetyl-CoA carboxylase biotin carboxylase subunit [Archaeoglobaceae archaeon]|nr:acetyl-CoA carboxylase biotin carboxylase subunit [Archaeoglobaceae archaeon]
MFKKILVANRGEIAIRVMRTCREMGIRTVAIYSSADENALHRYYADEAYHVGKADPKDSYLNIERIVEIAKKAEAEAIHPGYGFVSENPFFAKRCEEEGIVFIGPTPEVLEISGSKIEARKRMKEAGVPIVPGSPALDSVDEAYKWAEKIGYPVAVKASGGGGGIGISIAKDEKELELAFTKSKSFGEKYFRDPTVYLEKWLVRPRHIEVQILGDRRGKVIHLGERECSIQRRNQKLIEETPSPALTEELREEIGRHAVRGAKSIGYQNAGTFEFLYADGKFYFLEINARLQVEHTITEIVRGIDIVREQIKIAYGEEIPYEQNEIKRRGHAMEMRIYAEDPITFLPSGGRIEFYRSPGGYGVRLDSAISIGSIIPEDYDPMVSKLVVFGKDRAETIARGKRALMEYIILGITTNIPLHLAVLSDPEFEKGNTHTRFLEERKISEKVPQYIEKYVEAQTKLSKIFVDYESEKIREQLKKYYRATMVDNGKIEERLWRIYTSLGH